MARHEGSTQGLTTLVIENIPKSVTEDALREAIRTLSAGEILHGSLITPSGASEGEALVGARGPVVYRAEYTLDSTKAVDKVTRKAAKGHFVVNKVTLRNVRSCEWRPKAVEANPTTYFVASTVTAATALEADCVELVNRVQRDNLIPVVFDFSTKSLVWMYPDARENGIMYQFLLPFKNILPDMRFWTSGNDVLMLVRFMRRPLVSFKSSQRTNDAPMSPFLTAARPAKVEDKVHFLPHAMLELHRDQTAPAVRLAPMFFYADSSACPSNVGDSAVFRFKFRRDKMRKSPLFEHLRKEKGRGGRSLLGPKFSDTWYAKESTLRNVVRLDQVDVLFERYHHLAFDVRWRINVMMSNDIITYRAYRAVFPQLLNLCTRYDVELVCAALDKLIGESTSQRKTPLKIWDDKLREDVSRCVAWAAQSGARAALAPGGGPNFSYEHYHVPRLVITPSKIYCAGPAVETSNRMLRMFGNDHPHGAFVRATFLDENLSPMYHGPGEERKFSYLHVVAALKDGISLFGDRYEFIMYSQSQLRSTSCWFLRKSRGFETTGREHSPREIREWMGHMVDFPSAPKCAARMGLSLSATSRASDNIPETEFSLEDDILTSGGQEFTDGCGRISREFAKTVAQNLGLVWVPSCFQIRFRGFKGTLVSWDLPAGEKLRFRTSMKKHEVSAPTPLEVCDVSKFRPAYLNREIISLLSALGVKREVFERMQADFLQSLDLLLTEREQTIGLLHSQKLSGDHDWHRDLGDLLKSGLPLEEPFVRRSLMHLRHLHLRDLRTKSRVLVHQGALLYGVCDHGRVLKPNEVVITIAKQTGAAGVWQRAPILGKVVVTRNPCLHVGDIRVLEAVRAPESLSSLENVIVFPCTGTRPVADEMAGGDLDGDMFSVYWDSDLRPSISRDPMGPSPGVRRVRSPDTVVDVDDLITFFCDYLDNDNIGVLSNAHKSWAALNGASCEECVRLAELASVSLKYPKTGQVARMPRQLAALQMPHFMEHERKPHFRSSCTIGRMYDMVVAVAEEPPGRVQSKVMDESLLVERHEEYEADAVGSFRRYVVDVELIMDQYGLSDDALVVSGAATKYRKDLRGNDRDVTAKLAFAVRLLRHRYRDEFFSDLMPDDIERHKAKASAWYKVAYKTEKFLSFPWLVADVMKLVVQQSRARNLVPIRTKKATKKSGKKTVFKVAGI